MASHHMYMCRILLTKSACLRGACANSGAVSGRPRLEARVVFLLDFILEAAAGVRRGEKKGPVLLLAEPPPLPLPLPLMTLLLLRLREGPARDTKGGGFSPLAAAIVAARAASCSTARAAARALAAALAALLLLLLVLPAVVETMLLLVLLPLLELELLLSLELLELLELLSEQLL